MKLSHILFGYQVIVFLGDVLTILVMIDPLTAITFNDILTQQPHRLVGYLAFSCSLFGCQQIFDRVLGTANLKIIIGKREQ
jgi:hypothetical protein